MTDLSPAAALPDESLPEVDAPIVARAGRYYRNMRYILVAALLVFAAAFGYDGFKAWPARNIAIADVTQRLAATKNDDEKADLARQERELGAPKTDLDIALNKVLACVLPAAAICFLILMLRRSRGEIRLENNTLFAPGYAPIPLTSITSVDTSLWKKKGIAFVHFTNDGKAKSLRLDDFIYQQKPIDAIYDRLVLVNSAATPVTTPV